jgi:GTP-binding protein
MNIHNVSFVKSITQLNQRPKPLLPEIAVIGRSNVGKSSLINALFNRKNLAKISSTPGKTRLINYFSIDNTLYFVDLPGYGYAKLSKKMRQEWQKNIENYLKNNRFLRIVFLILDSRHEIMENDRMMIEWLEFFDVPFVFILTKSDKISNNQYRETSKKLRENYPDREILRFSSKNKIGREEILHILEMLNHN